MPSIGLTEGNPFFAEEMLAVLAETDTPPAHAMLDQRAIDALRIPSSVHDAVVHRLARVSPGAQRMARLAAVAGRAFDFALLQSLTQLDDTSLIAHVAELIGVHVFVEESAERLAFRHALTRQAIYGQLLARERQVLHGSLVKTIEELFGSAASIDHLADLAYHAYAARDWPRVRDYSPRMGDRARRMYAPALAVEHYGRAIEAAGALGESPSGQLFRARAQAYEVLGGFEAAEADFRTALEAARANTDRSAEWQGLLDLGFVWLARDYCRAGSFFDQALVLAETLGDRRQIVQSQNRLGNWQVNMDDSTRGLELHERALTTFRELGDRAGVAETLDLVGVATLIAGQRRRAIDTFELAAAAYRQLDDRRGLASVLATLAHVRCASRVYDTLPGAAPAAEHALPEAEEALTIARAIGSRSAEAYAASELAACLTSDGQFGAALAAVQVSQTIAQELEHGELTSNCTCDHRHDRARPARRARRAQRSSARTTPPNSPGGARRRHFGRAPRQRHGPRTDLVAAEALLRKHVSAEAQVTG